MQIVVVTNKALREELISNGIEAGADVVWVEDVNELRSNKDAEVVIDLLFESSHLAVLRSISGTVIINSVTATLAETDPGFVRINGWPGFLQSELLEAACMNEEAKQKAAAVFSLFHKKIEWLPDVVGFVTPRVISMIINEAFIALNEGVSTKEEINTAMKLGTNYPFGPFEWADRIGVSRVKGLLEKLAGEKAHYVPAVS